MALKTCAGCFHNFPPQELTRGRCPDCARRYDRAKMARRRARRGTTAQRGYDTEYRRRREAAIRAHPFCADCGHTGSKENPLTADHVVPLVDGGDPQGALRVLCRSCNSSRGAALAGRGQGSLEERHRDDPFPSSPRRKRGRESQSQKQQRDGSKQRLRTRYFWREQGLFDR